MASANNAFNLKGSVSSIGQQLKYQPVYPSGKPIGTSAAASYPSGQTVGSPTPAPTTSTVKQGTTPGILSSSTTQKKSSVDPSTLALQKQLNQKNQGQPGWVPLAEDGILGPKTQAAMNFKPQPVAQPAAQTIQPPTAPKVASAQTTAQPAQPVQQNFDTYPGLISQLSGMARTGSSDVQAANEALRKFQEAQAQTYAGIESMPIPIEFQQGRAQAVQRAAATKEAALSQNVQNALAAQGQQLGALGTAAGLLAPIQAPYSNQVLTYGTNGLLSPIASTSGSLQQAVGNAVQQIKNGAGYDNVVGTLSAYGPAGVQALLSALGPNFNINQSNAQAAAQASNLQTAGTVGTNTAASGYQGAIQTYQEMSTQNSAADAQAENVTNILNNTGINSSSTDFNKAINNLKGRLGSTAVTQLVSSITELQAIYTSLLSAGGGTPTGNEQQALTVLNPNSSPAQIIASLQQLQLAAYNKLKAQYDTAQTYAQNLGGGSNYQAPGASAGGNSGGFSWDALNY